MNDYSCKREGLYIWGALKLDFMTKALEKIEQQEVNQVNNPWYAIRTFNCQEQKVSRFLTERECVHFIPMTIALSKAKGNESPKRILVPAIHNLLFVQKKDTQQHLLQILKECTIPVRVFKNPGVDKLCEIPPQDIAELRMLCDPQFNPSVFLTQEEAEAMVGKEVRIKCGPFKGAIGRLIRKKKEYYFLKVVTGMGVMVRISRWYCEPV